MKVRAKLAIERKRILKLYLISMAVAVLVGAYIRAFLLDVYRIPSPSMRPTLEAGDTIFVWKRAWEVGQSFYQVGDVVVYSPPQDHGREYVRRIVAIEGDRVAIKAGRLIVNGVDRSDEKQSVLCGSEQTPLRKKYSVCWEPPLLNVTKEVEVPKNSVFVLGDLRSDLKIGNEYDSLKKGAYGVLPMSAIKGKAMWIWLSVEKKKNSDRTVFSKIRFGRMFKRIY